MNCPPKQPKTDNRTIHLPEHHRLEPKGSSITPWILLLSAKFVDVGVLFAIRPNFSGSI